MVSLGRVERALENLKDSGSRLYDYYLSHPENEIMRDLVESYHPMSDLTHFVLNRSDPGATRCKQIYTCYQRLFQDGHLDIILEMITNGQSIDEAVLCFIFIESNRKDLLSFLYQRGFDFNQSFTKFDIYSWEYYKLQNLLTHAYDLQGLEMVKYLIELGADVTYNDTLILLAACQKNDHETIDFLLNFDIAEKDLFGIIEKLFCYKPGLSVRTIEPMVVEKILQKGVNLAKYETEMYEFIGRCNLKVQKIFIDYGLPLASPKLLMQACVYRNIEAIEYFLEQGLQPDQETMEYLLTSPNKDTFRLLMKHRVDLSRVKIENNDDDLITYLENLGLDRNTLLRILLNFYCKK